MAGRVARRRGTQREATERWLAKPGVLEDQREKAQVRSANNRRKQRLLATSEAPPLVDDDLDRSSPGAMPTENSATSLSSLSIISEDAGPPPTLPSLRLRIDEWRMEWGPEGAWSKVFYECLQRARDHSTRATNKFFVDCEEHVCEGRRILSALRRIIHSPTRGGRTHVEDHYIQVYDISLAVVSELRFFEVKLDEYAPSVPSTRISDVRHYSAL
ncbi:hypothetical protein BV22DRAFT_1130495 [Leucogyrophana mollusca]|uniref:Uncharacterized protein n=1 Tax=Leucogyrophana mollusca TaxID=85980 RepID=A0ACB8BD92_9AGAM|nr:hypothetical protein BV22DRAFT_1130495 [Leucogyrophana mollusca]